MDPKWSSQGLPTWHTANTKSANLPKPTEGKLKKRVPEGEPTPFTEYLKENGLDQIQEADLLPPGPRDILGGAGAPYSTNPDYEIGFKCSLDHPTAKATGGPAYNTSGPSTKASADIQAKTDGGNFNYNTHTRPTGLPEQRFHDELSANFLSKKNMNKFERAIMPNHLVSSQQQNDDQHQVANQTPLALEAHNQAMAK